MDIFKAARWYKNTQPIAAIFDTIIAYNNGKILKIDDKSITVISRFNFDILDRVKEANRKLCRLFRREIRCACLARENRIIFFKDRLLYHLNLSTGEMCQILTAPNGKSAPLNITSSTENKYLAFWGDYFSNPTRDRVMIYGITKHKQIEEMFTFPQKTIRHIHNIISDGVGGYFIFAGDDDQQAGIYHSNRGFRQVRPIYCGEMMARAVIGFQTSSGLMFATDSVNEVNHIYLLNNTRGKIKKEEICKLNGPCIYGTAVGNNYIFSTTVESEESNGSKLAIFSRKSGPGILTSNVEVIAVDKEFNVRILGKIQKDNLPYKLFQYGAIRFPWINQSAIYFCFYPVAVNKYEGDMGVISIGKG